MGTICGQTNGIGTQLMFQFKKNIYLKFAYYFQVLPPTRDGLLAKVSETMAGQKSCYPSVPNGSLTSKRNPSWFPIPGAVARPANGIMTKSLLGNRPVSFQFSRSEILDQIAELPTLQEISQTWSVSAPHNKATISWRNLAVVVHWKEPKRLNRK